MACENLSFPQFILWKLTFAIWTMQHLTFWKLRSNSGYMEMWIFSFSKYSYPTMVSKSNNCSFLHLSTRSLTHTLHSSLGVISKMWMSRKSLRNPSCKKLQNKYKSDKPRIDQWSLSRNEVWNNLVGGQLCKKLMVRIKVTYLHRRLHLFIELSCS